MQRDRLLWLASGCAFAAERLFAASETGSDAGRFWEDWAAWLFLAETYAVL